MNKKFVWTKEYSVNVSEIDEQHKEFIKIVNNLLELSDKESFTDDEAFVKVSKLGDYAFYHLATEEDLFITTGYDSAPEHIAAHNKFREKAKDFGNQVRDKNKDKKIVLQEIALFAGDWLLSHILIADKKYTEFFNQKGLF